MLEVDDELLDVDELLDPLLELDVEVELVVDVLNVVDEEGDELGTGGPTARIWLSSAV